MLKMIRKLLTWLSARDDTASDPFRGLSRREIADLPAWHEPRSCRNSENDPT